MRMVTITVVVSSYHHLSAYNLHTVLGTLHILAYLIFLNLYILFASLYGGENRALEKLRKFTSDFTASMW